jgi:hypothetical protein
VYSIIITGYIPAQKVKEFKQHMKLMTDRLENQIFNMDVYQDMLHEDLYKVKMTFNDKKEMFSFMKSDNYTTISGSFRALGLLRDQHIETFSELTENTN